jgi:hypothetical protein
MKRLGIFMIFYGLILCNSVFAQQFEVCPWQLQNPVNASSSEIVSFDKGKFCYTTGNLVTQQTSSMKGTYSFSGNNLTLNFDAGQSFTFRFDWITANKIALSNNNKRLIYAKIGSPDDTFMQNLLNGMNSTGGYTGGGGNTTSQYQVCYTCQGTGSCKVCGGTGTYSAYGYSSPCSACNHTGKCWHCNGSGKQ